jgi:hypothetical protein
MRLLSVSVLVIALMFPSIVHGAGLKDEGAARALVDKAMAMLAKNDAKGAIESFAPYWTLPRAEVDVAVSKIVEQRKLLPGRFGKGVGVQFVEQKTVAGTLLRIVYLEKFENHAIRWIFLFYRPRSEWQFNFFNFDDKIHEMFEQEG